jgi:hypothetical protein
MERHRMSLSDREEQKIEEGKNKERQGEGGKEGKTENEFV